MASEDALVNLAVFLVASYASGQLATAIKISPIIAFITVGALLGPPFADFVPTADGVMLAGLLGIQLSVIDAGIGTNMDDLKHSALRAVIVAVLGVVFPIAGAILVLCLTDVLEGNFEAASSLRSAFAAGSAIAPTSLGVTARLLLEVGELETPLGQLVSIAAVFDDVISLVLLSEVVAIAGDNSSAWRLSQPIVFSAVFIIGALLMAFLLPRALHIAFERLHIPDRIIPKVGLWVVLLVAIAATYVATLAKTSFLLAGYLTGVAFAQTPSEHAKQPWKAHVEPHIEWLSMLFFAATIGFVIPVKDLFTASALGIGALLALVAVFGKLLCGLGMLPSLVDGAAVGVAMLGRGEFGFLIAAQAKAVGLISDRVYAATTWGVLVPTLVTPLVFSPVFRWRKRRLNNGGETSEMTNADEVELESRDT